MRLLPGDMVTCLYGRPAYYSGYNGNPVVLFKPGMIGTVAGIAPKVFRLRKAHAPGDDTRHDFVVVDFECDGATHRVGLHFANVALRANKPD